MIKTKTLDEDEAGPGARDKENAWPSQDTLSDIRVETSENVCRTREHDKIKYGDSCHPEMSFRKRRWFESSANNTYVVMTIL